MRHIIYDRYRKGGAEEEVFSIIAVIMAVTLQNLTDIGYDILREEEDVKAYPLSFMQQLMNTAQLRICSGMVKNPMTGETIRK